MPTGGYEVAHDTGRWWDAMLRLEEAIGFIIPDELEEALLRNLKTLTESEILEFAGYIHQSGLRLLKLINDLLALSKTAAGSLV